MTSAITFGDLERCRDIVDLLALLVHRSINQIFEYTSGLFDIHSIYRWAAANKVCDILIIFTRHLCDSASTPGKLIL